MADISQSERDSLRKQGKAMTPVGGGKGGRFPIRNGSDLSNAIHSVGRASGSHAAVRAYIKRRAAALGLSSKIPDGW
jgi:hypothetical protein